MAVAEAILLLRGELLLGGPPQGPGLGVPQLLPQRPPLEEAQSALVIPAMEAKLEAESRRMWRHRHSIGARVYQPAGVCLHVRGQLALFEEKPLDITAASPAYFLRTDRYLY